MKKEYINFMAALTNQHNMGTTCGRRRKKKEKIASPQ